MAEEDPSLLVLHRIHKEIQGTNSRLEGVEGRLDSLHAEVGGLRKETHDTNVRVEDLARRQTESEIRLATEVVSVARGVGEVRDLLRDRLDDRQRVDDLERRVSVLETRVG